MLHKKNIRFLIYFIFPVLIMGCRDIPQSELTTIYIPNKTDDPVLLSEMAITDKKIKLETRDGVFLGYIRDVKLHRDRLFVSDTKISIFDLEGYFIQFLVRQGEGPGEYKALLPGILMMFRAFSMFQHITSYWFMGQTLSLSKKES